MVNTDGSGDKLMVKIYTKYVNKNVYDKYNLHSEKKKKDVLGT